MPITPDASNKADQQLDPKNESAQPASVDNRHLDDEDNQQKGTKDIHNTIKEKLDPTETCTCYKDKTHPSDYKEPYKKDSKFLHADMEVPTSSTIEGDRKNFEKKVFTRLSARYVKFKEVSFFQTTFDACYFNHCSFDNCKFVGCRFVGCNLNQSSFIDCNFEYANFERTQIDNDILNCAPKKENLRIKFSRTLRMNYQQIGDARSVNRAILTELEAIGDFLKKSWLSEEDYYRRKYRGFKRVGQFGRWIEFKALHYIWGNGESVKNLLLSILAALFFVGLINQHYTNGLSSLITYPNSFKDAPAIFLGALKAPDPTPTILTAAIVALRLLSFAFLTAILVKRFGRR